MHILVKLQEVIPVIAYFSLVKLQDIIIPVILFKLRRSQLMQKNVDFQSTLQVRPDHADPGMEVHV